MALELHWKKQAAKVAHINIGEEKHGEEDVRRLDIKVQSDVVNDFLTYLSKTLKGSLYGKEEGQRELIKDDSHLPHSLYPELGEMKWEGEMADATVILHGKTKAEDLNLVGDVNNVRIQCKEGGTVAVTLRVQVKPDDEQTSALVLFSGKDVKISIRPKEPEAETGDAKP